MKKKPKLRKGKRKQHKNSGSAADQAANRINRQVTLEESLPQGG